MIISVPTILVLVVLIVVRVAVVISAAASTSTAVVVVVVATSAATAAAVYPPTASIVVGAPVVVVSSTLVIVTMVPTPLREPTHFVIPRSPRLVKNDLLVDEYVFDSEYSGLEKRIPGGQSTFRDGPCNPRSGRGGDGNLGGGNSLKKIFRMYYAFFAVTGQQRS